MAGRVGGLFLFHTVTSGYLFFSFLIVSTKRTLISKIVDFSEE